MDALESIQAELTIKIGEIDELCRRYQYDVTPTIILRHSEGASKSMLLGNDSISQLVLCLAELGDTAERSDQTPYDAILKLFAAK